MTVLLDERVPRTLDALVAEWSAEDRRGARLEAWLFEDEPARRKAEAALAEAGVTARLRSAYKPLVHAFLEEIDTKDLARVEIVYPVHPTANPIRFLSEAYPLAGLLEGVETVFTPGDEKPVYRVTAQYRDGRTAEHEVFAPNRIRRNHLGLADLCPTGWMRASAPSGLARDEALTTEIETVFDRVMATVAAHPWPAEEPYAETLAIDVSIAGIERPLDYGDEVMSTREALHEDFYFSLLEFFKHRSGRPPEDRGLQPGQIVPDIRAGEGDAHVRVALLAFGRPQDPVRPEQVLETADAAPGLAQIYRDLAELPGQTFEGISREGRPVRGIYRPGRRPAILVSAGQHANETSAPVGALRAARRLLADPDVNLALIAVENPDGYALHGRLCEANPRHMHHAARYTSLGSDVEFDRGNPTYEIGARNQALELSGAELHVNLHGYPAHEWTRPFTGYLPRGFELWAIPKGFFLIMRHHPAWAGQARALIEAVTKRLQAIPGLAAFNRRQIEICAIHSGGTPYEIVNDIPCLVTAEERHPSPLTLITEFPDETIYGEPFRFAHTVQMTTVLAAEEAFAAMMAQTV
ncbi:M14 family zinc carboxypeptidase [Microvirga sp. 17 mud 1-3]|uniref:M14 family zinc carboxypeptidase n=1 Tax=Microvirga sp. 17 mud 1-3 TaxID=2082949 RepID=UPI000D6C3246|nr:M14 family zinc carboxypeptidase [Microvirga sp. 17 mud 1-3]AWM86408.1 peptidase M14 [Microvirga sp. 17 mud 1-3]